MRLAAGLPVVSAGFPLWAFGSKEFWEAKPSADWNSEEVDRMITKSPWAKEVTASNGTGPGGPGNGGGMGRSRGGGIGFPGGGIGGGYPGGGYPGGGYPGGGYPSSGGYPNGGGYPGGGSGGPGGGARQFSGTVRWESALPIQEALRIGASDEKPDPDFAKYYVIGLIGDLPTNTGRRRRNDDNSDDDDAATQSDRRLERFKESTRLEVKERLIRLEKVEEGSRIGSRGPGTYFYFSRMDDISMDDKQVIFSTKLGQMEIKAKFTIREMLYHGKLAV